MPFSCSTRTFARRFCFLTARVLSILVVIGAALTPAVPYNQAGSAGRDSASRADRFSSEVARDVVTKIVGAYGGADKLKMTKTMPYRSHGTHRSISGVSGASNSLVCDITAHGDKIRLETQMLGQPMILGFNGTTGWTQFGDWVNPSSETTVKRMSDEMRHGLSLLCDINDPACKVEYTGKKAAQKRTCDVLRVYAADGKPTTFYADQASHLILRSEFVGVDHEQGVPALQSVEYFDYRPIGGTLAPYKTVEYTGSKETSDTALDRIELGVNVDDGIFEMPPESQVARVKEGPVTIPFDYVANQIIVNARINSADYRFIVDTGASQTVLDKATALSLGRISQSDFSITAGSKALPLSYMTIPAFTVGDVTLDNVSALVTDLSAVAGATGQKTNGLLGANILRRFLVTIDFRDRKIILADPHQVSIPEHATVLKTSPVYGATALVIPGKLDNKLNLNFLVDTGAGFSNLPQSAVRSLNPGALLPVGQIYGVDGKKLSIGSARFQSLRLGTLDILDPVFALSPETTAVGGASGLFTAGALGILGNPVWSKFRTTIDYRNERLILEPLPAKLKLMACSNQLRRIDRQYRIGRDLDLAVKSCESIIKEAHQNGSKGCEAIGLAALAEYYLIKARSDKNPMWQSLASKQFATAESLARQSGEGEAAARVLALWAGQFVSTTAGATGITTARRMLQQALAASPAEPAAYAWLGTLLLNANNTDLAKKMLDQALMLDPSCWTALWSEYKLYQSASNFPLQLQVLAALQRYYPNSPEILAMSRQRNPFLLNGRYRLPPRS